MTPAATFCFESAPNQANIPLFPIVQMDVDGEMERYYSMLWLKTCRRPLGQHKYDGATIQVAGASSGHVRLPQA